MFLVELGTEQHLTMENLVICCLDLFAAGQFPVQVDFPYEKCCILDEIALYGMHRGTGITFIKSKTGA